ncbi:MAG TPA: hypothetical protein VK348_04030, partial [Planctomycetota bacterium]|nr:hypothetical protein [Planctomycetota bacterium]
NSGGGLLSNLLAALLGTVNGTPTGLVVPALSLTPQTLFRMRPARIEEFSDLVLQRGIYHNDRIVQDQLVYAAGELTVSPLAPLRGRMVLFVNGNFNAVAGNGSDLSGVLVVTGNTYIQGPFRLRGTLLTQGHVELGSGTGPVDILYDRASVQRVQQEIGKYRKSSSTRPNGTGGASTPVENLAADYTVMAAR